jgi:thioredoxin reductase (NADPH)
MPEDQTGTKARIYGQFISPESYEMRDYLGRLVVNHEWVEIKNDEDSMRELGMPFKEVQFPVIDCPRGDRFFRPSKKQIAEHMGWTFKPGRDEYDVVILGGGPAGLSAAVYAASEGLSTLLIEKHAIGGQAGSSSLIENYLGFPDGVSGVVLTERARQQAVKFGAELILMQEGIRDFYKNGKIAIQTKEGIGVVSKALVCATGVNYRKLDIPEEDKYLNKGLYYGAGTSEGPYCINENIFIIGGGNSAGQAAMNLAQYAKKVTVVVRSANLADSLSQYLIDRIENTDNIEVMYESSVTGLYGEGHLESVEITSSGKKSEFKTSRLFVCIGGKPNIEYSEKNGFLCDPSGYIITGQDILTDTNYSSTWKEDRPPYHLETSIKGVFAIGDLRHNSIKRIASAVGEGAIAISFVHEYLRDTGYISV